jgi:site-specific recombinase XerD
MASFIRHRNGIYYIVFFKQGKRVWRSLQTRDKGAAYKLFLKQADEDTRPKGVMLKQAQCEFLTFANTNFSRGTIDIYRNTFSQFNKFLSDRAVTEITPRDIDFYKSTRFQYVSPATVNLELRSLRAFFNRLIVWDYIEKNPCESVKAIRIAETIRPFLSKDDLSKLLDHTRGTQLCDIILIATMTGLRKGELLNLSWADVDLQKGTLLVRSSMSYRTKGGKMRMVPLNTTALNVLKNLPQNSSVVFPPERGESYNHDFLSRRFKRAINQCGLDPKLHFHSLRHTFASLLVKDGVPLYHVQRLLGHSSARVTEIYAHLGHAELGSSVEKLSMSI